MSLLDDVSIVVTPNGYKAGELYAVVPVPTEGAELVTNRDFSSGTTGWTEVGDFAISGGKASITSASQYSQLTSQQGTNFLTSGKQYKLQVDIETLSISGVFAYRVTGGEVTPILTSDLVGGVYTTYFTMISDGYIWFQTTGSYTGLNVTIDNVSVKEYTSVDMDVTRATAATRVDEDGLVNYAEIVGGELLNCNSFNCADPAALWSEGSGWSFSGGKAIYDGTGGTSPLAQSDVIEVGKTYRVSIEVLSNEGTGANTIFLGGTVLSAVNLSVGTHVFYGATNNTSVILTIYGRSGEVFEIGSVSVKEAARDNVPRIDYTGGGCPHILAEPQRTNLFLQSEDFTSEWSTSDATITANSTISPDGTQNASILTTTASGGTVQESLSISDGDIAFSLFVKKGSTDGVRLRIDASTDFNGYFDLTDGTIHSATGNAKIEPLDNDWYKISVAASVTSFVKASIYTTDGTTSYDNGTVFIWGAQLEEGSYPTSYIPTSGSTVTRNQDIFTRDGIGSLINSTEGVLFTEMAALADDGVAKYLSMNDGSSNNDVRIYFNTASNGISALLKSTTGATQAFLSYTVTDTTAFHKIAFVYAVNRFELWVDGEKRAEDLSGIAPVGLTTLEFSRASNFLPLFAKVKQLQVYNTALTDEQLLQLTGTSGTDFYESYAEMASALTYTIQ